MQCLCCNYTYIYMCVQELSAVATPCGHSVSVSKIALAFRTDQDKGNLHTTNKSQLDCIIMCNDRDLSHTQMWKAPLITTQGSSSFTPVCKCWHIPRLWWPVGNIVSYTILKLPPVIEMWWHRYKIAVTMMHYWSMWVCTNEKCFSKVVSSLPAIKSSYMAYQLCKKYISYANLKRHCMQASVVNSGIPHRDPTSCLASLMWFSVSSAICFICWDI